MTRGMGTVVILKMASSGTKDEPKAQHSKVKSWAVRVPSRRAPMAATLG